MNTGSVDQGSLLRLIGSPQPPTGRLLERLAAKRGGSHDNANDTTWVIGPETHPDPGAISRAASASAGVRFLVLSWIGSHPDARSPLLRGLWDQEERARTSGRPVMTLRLAPLLGPQTPLLSMLRSRPPLPRHGRDVIQPLAEDDVIETLERALSGVVAWEGWYELVGNEALSLAEWVEMAAGLAPQGGAASGWEPPLEVMAEQRLAEPDAWLGHFGMSAQPLGAAMAGWSA